jgi:hypothetical protein
MVKAAVKIKYNKYLGIGRVNMIRQNFRNIFNKNKKTFTHVFFLKVAGREAREGERCRRGGGQAARERYLPRCC